ncbi:unnamed protein product, partial [Brassica oleracea]
LSVTYLELTSNIYVSQVLALCSHTALLDESETSHKLRERWNPLFYSSVSIVLSFHCSSWRKSGYKRHEVFGFGQHIL